MVCLLPKLGARHRVVALGFFGFFNVYAMRVNLSVASIPMSDELHWCGIDTNNTNANSTDYLDASDNSGDKNCALKGNILSSFFYGYIVTQIIGGYISARFGGKHVFGLGILCTSVLTILTPVAARAGSGVLIAVRILEGFGEGVTFPAFHAILGRWVPAHERTKLSTLAYAGAYAGTVASNPLSGYLCDQKHFLGGWPSVFYVFGGLGVVWYILWLLLYTSSPSKDPWITQDELTYIEGKQSLRKADPETERLLGSNTLDDDEPKSESNPVPWRHIFSSTAVWAIIFGHMTNNWGFYNLLTCMPNYMKGVLDLDISKLGFISSVPFVALWFTTMGTGWLADYARARGIKTVYVRKTCQICGQIIQAVSLVAVGYVEGPHAHTLAIVALTVSVGAGGLCQSGFNVNHLDIAPKYAGVLMGITNTAATIPGFVTPILTLSLTTADPDTQPEKLKEQWRTVFWIAGGVYCFGILFFMTFAKGEPLPWANGFANRNRLNVN